MNIKKIAFIIDPIESINPKKDTTLAFAQAALEKDFAVYLIEAHKICLMSENKSDAIVLSAAQQVLKIKQSCKFVLEQSSLTVHDVMDLGAPTKINCANLDIVMLRKDPPVDENYIYLTYFLDHLLSKGVKVINNPQSVRDVNEKFYILNYPELISPTLISGELQQINDFLQKHKKLVLKPLNAMGGQGIISVDIGEVDKIKTMLQSSSNSNSNNIIMAQKFLDINKAGDKRILLIKGKPVPYALARFPKAGSFLANLAAGGHGTVVPLTQRDLEICTQLSPMLIEKGLEFVGLDVIDGHLTEINVTSPTCLREINQAHDLDLAATIF